MHWDRAVRATLTAALCLIFVVYWVLPHTKYIPPPNHKVILTWVSFFGDPYFGFGAGQSGFKRAGCAENRCELTVDRTLLPLDRFDALIFHGFEFYQAIFGKPSRRSPQQLYVYMTLEAARRSAIPENLETFYNYTMTYRLDSDVPWPYFIVVDRRDREVAPVDFPSWEPNVSTNISIWNETLSLVAGKTKAAAWFVSNCHTNSRREYYVRELEQLLPVDIYGACGSLRCSSSHHTECAQMVGERYYFYLAFENSLCKDYVTEKAVWALSAGAVPVVRAGAELIKFLPPGSYLEADPEPRVLASRLRALMESPEQYLKLLRWRSQYHIEMRGMGGWPQGQHPLCTLCAHLHENKQAPTREISVRRWWMGAPDEPTCS